MEPSEFNQYKSLLIFKPENGTFNIPDAAMAF